MIHYLPAMKLALLQPSLIPDLHYLSAVLKADQIFIQDTERYSRKGRVHRFQVRGAENRQWLQLPVRTEDKKKQIREVRIDHGQNWFHHIAKVLKVNYANSIYYEFYEPEILADFEQLKQKKYLIDAVYYMNRQLAEYFELKWNDVDVQCQSQTEINTNDPDAIALHFGADILFQEHEGRNFQRQSATAVPSLTKHPEYRQHFENFMQDCSLLDLLFERGPESFKIFDEIMS